MGCLACGSDDHAEPLFLGSPGKGTGLLRRAVGGVDMHLVGHPVLLQFIHGFFHDGQVAVTAHDDTYFFHKNHPL